MFLRKKSGKIQLFVLHQNPKFNKITNFFYSDQRCESPQPPHHRGGVIFFTNTLQMVGLGDF